MRVVEAPAATPPVLQIGMTVSRAFRSGTDRYFVGLVRELTRRSASVRAIAIGDADAAARERVPLRAFAPPEAGRLTRWRGLRRAVDGTRDDVALVAAHGIAHAFPVLDRIGRLPLVVHYHGPWSREASGDRLGRATVALRALQERAVLARASRCIVLSKAYASLLIDDFGVPADRIHVIAGGIELRDFASDAPVATARRALGLPAAGPLVGCASRLSAGKGIFALLDAFAIVRTRSPAAHLALAGAGPERAAVEARVAAFGLRDAVTLLGHLDDAMPAFYRAVDFTVVPTPHLEGFGLVAIESLALGTPVLVTPVGGLREAVAGLGASVLFDGTDAGALARGMFDALDGRRVLPAGPAARAFVERYAWERVAPRVVDVYRAAVASG